jgi:hypothetical protein
LREFEKLCSDMGLTDLYVAYMIESGYVHPSADGADVYLEPGDEGRVHLRNASALEGTPLRMTATFALLGTWAFASVVGGPDGVRLAELVDEATERIGVDVRPLVTRPMMRASD